MSYTIRGLDAWLTNAPDPREDALFECEEKCGWRVYFRYASDAPEKCPDCDSNLVEGDVEEYYADLEADAADRAYDAMRERDY